MHAKKAVAEPWVVTYRAELKGVVSTNEYFRGTEAECFRIANAFGGWGEDDRLRNVGPWRVLLGPVREWEKFLREWSDPDFPP